MSKRFEEHLERLRSLNAIIRHNCEQAEAKIEEVNLLVRRLGEMGWGEGVVFLGAVIAQLPYASASGRSDSGRVLRSVLHVPLGIGIAAWDSEDYCQLARVDDALEAETQSVFVPFADCEPAVKALLYPQIELLLARLMEHL